MERYVTSSLLDNLLLIGDVIIKMDTIAIFIIKVKFISY